MHQSMEQEEISSKMNRVTIWKQWRSQRKRKRLSALSKNTKRMSLQNH